MNTLLAQSRALFSLRTTLIHLALVFFGMASGGCLITYVMKPEGPITLGELLIPASLAAMVMVFGAAMAVGTELSRGMAPWQYLSTNNRAGLVVTQLAVLWLAFVIAAVSGVALAALLIGIFGNGVDVGSISHPEVQPYVVAALLDWTVFPLLAAGLAWVLNSGSLAAMIVLADYLVVEMLFTSLPVPSLHTVAAWLPGMNIQLLAHGEITIAPDRPLYVAGLTLAGGVLLVVLGAVAMARRRAVK